MKKILLFLLLAMTVFTFFAGCDSTKSDDGNARFVIGNRIQSDDNIIQEVYVKRNNATDWGPNMISVNLQANQNATITKQSHLIQAGTFDLRVRTVGGRSFERLNVLLRNGAIIEFMDDSFAVQNRIDVAGIQVEISSIQLKLSSESNWGSNLLHGTFAFGTDVAIVLPYPLNSADRYDLRLIGNSNSIYQKTDIRINHGSSIEFTVNDMYSEYYIIRNNTYFEYHTVFEKLSSETNWRSFNRGLPSRSSIVIFAERGQLGQYRDFRADHIVGSATKRNVFVRHGDTVTFVEGDWIMNGQISIFNRINGFTIDQAFLKVSTASDWGQNLLSSPINSNTFATWPLGYVLEQGVTYDVRVRAYNTFSPSAVFFYRISDIPIFTFNQVIEAHFESRHRE